MSITVVTQPIFIVSTASELQTDWPSNSFAWVNDENAFYHLEDGVWMDYVGDRLSTSLTPYITSTALVTILSEYEKTADHASSLATALSSYSTTVAMNSAISSALSAYVTSSGLSAVLSSYATISMLSSYLTVTDSASIPRVWVNGVRKTDVKEVIVDSTVSGGSITFSLTDTAGNAIFGTEVYKGSVKLWIDDSAGDFNYGSYNLAGDRKSITFSVTKQATTNGNALLNLIGGVVSVVTGIVFNPAPNGTVVYLRIMGK